MSPNHPLSYPNSARCTWTIEGPMQANINLNVVSFKLQNADNDSKCRTDWFEVSITSNLIMNLKNMFGDLISYPKYYLIGFAMPYRPHKFS